MILLIYSVLALNLVQKKYVKKPLLYEGGAGGRRWGPQSKPKPEAVCYGEGSRGKASFH